MHKLYWPSSIQRTLIRNFFFRCCLQPCLLHVSFGPSFFIHCFFYAVDKRLSCVEYDSEGKRRTYNPYRQRSLVACKRRLFCLCCSSPQQAPPITTVALWYAISKNFFSRKYIFSVVLPFPFAAFGSVPSIPGCTNGGTGESADYELPLVQSLYCAQLSSTSPCDFC